MHRGPIPHDQGGLDILSPANPPGNSQVLITVPSDERWRVWGLAFTITTDATGVNRTPGIDISDGIASFIYASTNTFQGPSLTIRWHVMNNWPTLSAGLGNDKIFPGVWPILLPPSAQINAATINWQFGDRITVIKLLRERWLET